MTTKGPRQPREGERGAQIVVTEETHPGDAFARGIALFNRGAFFDAHEQLEDAWRAARGEARLFLQGLTQAAVALHHYSSGNRAGATSVLARALRNLSNYPPHYRGIELERLRQDLKEFHSRLLEGAAILAVPRIGVPAPPDGEAPASR